MIMLDTLRFVIANPEYTDESLWDSSNARIALIVLILYEDSM